MKKINLFDQIMYFFLALIFVIYHTLFATFFVLKYLLSVFFGFISLIFKVLLVVKISSEKTFSCICKTK